jgi:hypothetical protein
VITFQKFKTFGKFGRSFKIIKKHKMKNKLLRYIPKMSFALVVMGIVLGTSCKKQEDTSPPTIEKLRLTLKDSIITGAGSGNTVAIIGTHLGSTQKVFFNDYSALVNPSYVQEGVVLIQVPKDAPYRNTTNKIKLVTLYGEALKDFTIIQPEPTITSFAPQAGNAGDIVTVIGKDLDNVKKVFIGSDTTPVKLVAGGTDTQLKFIVPANNPAGQITIVTTGGETKSTTSFGISFLIYDDKMASGWDAYEWDAEMNTLSTEQVKKGKSIKMTFTKAYGGFGVGTDTKIDIKKYTAIKVSIYVVGNEAETKIKAGIKGADNTTNAFGKVLVLKPGWNDLTLEFAKDLNKPDRLQEFQLQEWGNAKIPVIYIDDIGVL